MSLELFPLPTESDYIDITEQLSSRFDAAGGIAPALSDFVYSLRHSHDFYLSRSYMVNHHCLRFEERDQYGIVPDPGPMKARSVMLGYVTAELMSVSLHPTVDSRFKRAMHLGSGLHFSPEIITEIEEEGGFEAPEGYEVAAHYAAKNMMQVMGEAATRAINLWSSSASLDQNYRRYFVYGLTNSLLTNRVYHQVTHPVVETADDTGIEA